MASLLGDLESLRETFLRDARAYAKQGGTKDGDRASDSTAWQQCCANHAGVYRVAAHEVGKLIRKHKKAPPSAGQTGPSCSV